MKISVGSVALCPASVFDAQEDAKQVGNNLMEGFMI